METTQERLSNEATSETDAILTQNKQSTSSNTAVTKRIPSQISRQAETFTVHGQSNTIDMPSSIQIPTHKDPPGAEAFSSQSELNAEGTASGAEKTLSKTTSEAGSSVLKNKSSTNSTAPESVTTASKADVSPKTAKKLRYEQLKQKFANEVSLPVTPLRQR